MASLAIHCPHCQSKLKIDNPKLLGKKVKCPGCKQPFELKLPESKPEEEEVKLELVTDEPPVGKAAKWVPDSAQSSAQPQFPGVEEPQVPLFPTATDDKQAAPVFPSPPSEPAAPVIPQEPASSVTQQYLKKKKKGSWVNYVVIGVIGVAALGTLGFAISKQQEYQQVQAEAEELAEQQQVITEPAKLNPNEPYSRTQLASSRTLLGEFEPTEGGPIELLMMPSGVNFVIHLRPSLMWSEEFDYKVLRASLTDEVVGWMGEQLKNLSRHEPQEIEEALIGFILGPRGTAPEMCAVIRLAEPSQRSDLLEKFPGEYLYDITERPELTLRIDDKNGYLIHDEKTIAICPKDYAHELEHWVTTPNYEITEGMTQLLTFTDRQRLVTMVGEMGDLRRHIELMPNGARQSVDHLLQWFGEDIETASWSVHTTPYLHSEIYLRPRSTESPARVSSRLTGQLEELPEIMWKQVCLKMQPTEMRFRKFIGRFPAMLEAFQQSTVITNTDRNIQLTTVLPGKAVPNLALATLFTANEAARTDFTVETEVMVADNEPKLPETVVGRMKMTVDAEFTQTPLEVALQYLCDEVQVKLALDGDALKDAGWTKNMVQNFTLGKVPMEAALKTIVDKYQEDNSKMAVSIDEANKTIHVLTVKFAERQNMQIHKFE